MKSFTAALLKMMEGLIDPGRLIFEGATTWLPAEHKPRLEQYGFFRALGESRFAELRKDAEEAKRVREYGDANLVNTAARDAVIGDRCGVAVPGSNNDPRAGARQRLLDKWARRERWAMTISEGELDAATVGDYVLELRPDGPRLRLIAHAPELFFPAWRNLRGDFDDAALAWEEPNVAQWMNAAAQAGADMASLRAQVGEHVLYMRRYRVVRDKCLVTAGWYRLEFGGRTTDRPTMRDLELLAYERGVSGAEFVDFDTGFSTPPLFHVPNLKTTTQPWGLPELAYSYQALTDLHAVEADIMLNSKHLAFPVMYDENPPTTPRADNPGTPSQEVYKPGVIYNGRKLGVVDLSFANAGLHKDADRLEDRILTNTATTAAYVGKVKPNEVPSGFAIVIGMLPLIRKTAPKREIRNDKLGLLLKHVLRWHRASADARAVFTDEDVAALGLGRDGQGWPTGMWEDEEAYPAFGSVLPMDKEQVSRNVSLLMTAGAISEETAVATLVAAGFLIDDAGEEVKRLRAAAAPTAGQPGSGLGREGRVSIPGLDDPGDDEDGQQ